MRARAARRTSEVWKTSDRRFLPEGSSSIPPLVQAANGSEDGFQVIVNVPIREPEDAEAQSLEVGVPIPVVEDLRVFFMDRAVQLQDELELVAVEVRDVGADRHLAAKLEAEEFPIAQVLPESLFRGSADPPQPLRVNQGALIGNTHGVMISPRGFPTGRNADPKSSMTRASSDPSDPHHPGPLLPASPPPAGRRGGKAGPFRVEVLLGKRTR